MAIFDGHFSGPALRKSAPLSDLNPEISLSSFAKVQRFLA